MTRATPAAIAMLLLALFGCQTVVSHGEYEAYKKVRYAEDDAERLVTMQGYLADYPEGRWAPEYNEFRDAREQEVWAENQATIPGLEFYLAAYPSGRYARLAERQLTVRQQQAEARASQDQTNVRAADQQRRQRAREANEWVSQAVEAWTEALLEVTNYGAPLGAVARSNERFSDMFGRRPPRPICRPAWCLKRYGQTYYIPVPGATRIDRRIDVFVRLDLDDGRLRRVEFLLPGKGFSRWYELENQEAIIDEDPAQRQAAVDWAVAKIRAEIQRSARSAQPTDFTPEPIPALPEIRQQAAAEAQPAEGEGGDEGGAEEPAEAAADAAEESAEPAVDDDVDELLRAAAGVEEEAPPEPVVIEPEPEPEQVVFPIGLLAYDVRNLRVVVFAAGDEDYGSAFDGFFIELR
ncbi:MAG: hypothetical protein ACFCGT_10085 [Sandaracinaceae bacterium]